MRAFAQADRFLTEVQSRKLRPAYVFVGDETFFRKRCREAILDHLVPSELRDFSLFDFDLVETDLAEVLDRARTPSLMAPFQVFFIKGVKTMFGRRRLVPELNSRNFQIRSAAERMAVNMPIQGSAADIMKRAMIDVHAALVAHPDARMILTVHDELLFEVPRARAEELSAIVQEKMQSAVQLRVPLTVDVGIGDNWKDAKS